MPHALPAFILAVILLMLIPGPNVSLIVANSVAHGARYGLMTVAGTASAMVVQLILTCLGLHEALGLAGRFFGWLRWAGVAYLIWLGIKAWGAPVAGAEGLPKSTEAVLGRAFFVSLTNPKTLFFYGALFPQFIDPHRSDWRQMLVLSGSFIITAVLVDAGWAFGANGLRQVITRYGRLQNRLTGGLLIGAGVGLAAARHG
jgi:threonine/homoserine/homoserine lactone efflux protein